MAEIELSVFNRRCLDRRMPEQELVERKAAAWEHVIQVLLSVLLARYFGLNSPL